MCQTCLLLSYQHLKPQVFLQMTFIFIFDKALKINRRDPYLFDVGKYLTFFASMTTECSLRRAEEACWNAAEKKEEQPFPTSENR